MGRAGSSKRDRRVQPPRPPNAWILYRTHQSKQIRENNERLPQATVSKLISDMWKKETPDVKRQFEQEAEKRKVQHRELFPGYRFCPQRKVKKSGRKKSKCRDVTLSDDEEADDDDAPPPVPAFLPGPNTQPPQPQAQPFLVPGYPHNMAMPQPFLVPYLPEAHYGPGGPSPPISAAPSPARNQDSASPVESPPENEASSSSSPSVRSSSSFQSQASTSSQLLANPTYLPCPPNSYQPSPNPYAIQPLSTLLFQNSTLAELPLTSPRPQLQVTENTVTPTALAWSNIPTYLSTPDAQNSGDFVNLDVAISQTSKAAEWQQALSLNSSFEGMPSRIDNYGVFNLPMVESSAILNPPNGDLEVVMGPGPPTVDYSDEYFAGFDFDDFEGQLNSLGEGSSSSAPAPPIEDFQSLFRIPNNSEFEAYGAARQRQPSVFTQDMMSFLNFEAADNSSESGSPAASPTAVDPTVVAPQQVRFQSPQAAAAIPIFTQMTNTPTVTSGTPYVPPAGAVYSSTRRVGASWKPPIATSHSEVNNSIPFWTL